jgi:hypothetical protein
MNVLYETLLQANIHDRIRVETKKRFFLIVKRSENEYTFFYNLESMVVSLKLLLQLLLNIKIESIKCNEKMCNMYVPKRSNSF